MITSQKKERSSNFTTNELVMLLDIIKNFKHIVECKKTDTVTWKEKDDAWEKITELLNANGETERSKKSVLSKYNDMKKNLKKKLAANKAETFKTDGGIPIILPLTLPEEILYSILPMSIEGLPTPFDSDSLRSNEDNVACNYGSQNVLRELNHDENMNTTVLHNAPEQLSGNLESMDEDLDDPSVYEKENTPSLCTKSNTNIIQKGVRVLKKKVSTELQTKSKGVTVSEKFSTLAEARIELLKLQKSTAEYELQAKKEIDEINKKKLLKELELKSNEVLSDMEIKELQLQNLKLDLQLKKAELKLKLDETNESDFDYN
ncbi:myb/SANT-like DNA-binding domain-containing protein 4 [Prorops nasuta]|uniref:myb/SANT-like DNA-binding domain-containing protein 4 n=1 Tax=Prorops nasuta TaxID=863751 RepID=UPI0034CFE9F4